MIYRSVRRSDLPALEREIRRNFAEEDDRSGYDSVELVRGLNRSLRFPGALLWAIRRGLHASSAYFLVAQEGGELAGTTLLTLAPTHAYVSVVMTSPPYRRRGVARHLLAWAEEIARRRGRPYVVLDVQTTNLPARKLYQSRGYLPLRSLRWFLHDGPIGEGRDEDMGARAAQEEDLLPLWRLWLASHPEEVRRALFGDGDRLPRYSASEPFQRAESVSWCLGPAGRPTGYVQSIWLPPLRVGRISSPVFAPEASPGERRGLIRQAMAWLGEHGAQKVAAEVPRYHEDSVRELTSLGFHPTGEIETLCRPLLRGGGSP